jgi:glutamyl-Q tRNA(Asp) synthetase
MANHPVNDIPPHPLPVRPVVGRFAPSPTGPLHFGSLIAAVGSYCLARRAGGRWLLRIEDLDTPRVVPGAADEMLRTLERLGLCWDGEVVRQSGRQEAYLAALEQLRSRGLLYPCGCSRREILASAPHPGEEGPVYPGTCRAGLPEGRAPRALRITVPERVVGFEDGVFGRQEQHLAHEVGDFVLRRADGLFAYQLAVVVDDADSGVSQVVRGADLLSSTPRQLFLLENLALAQPDYWHLPLALNPDGSKISKRCGDGDELLAGGGGEAVSKALLWLGQRLPGELVGAPPAELLAWGAAAFEGRDIPTVKEIAVDSGGKSR